MELDSGEPVIRLYADDPDAAARIRAIDLDDYDLVLYPAGETNWPLEQGRVRFIKTALELGLPWPDVVHATALHLGQFISPPPMPIVNPFDAPPLTPPYFDAARQTLEDRLRVADEACKAYLAQCAQRSTRTPAAVHPERQL